MAIAICLVYIMYLLNIYKHGSKQIESLYICRDISMYIKLHIKHSSMKIIEHSHKYIYGFQAKASVYIEL